MIAGRKLSILVPAAVTAGKKQIRYKVPLVAVKRSTIVALAAAIIVIGGAGTARTQAISAATGGCGLQCVAPGNPELGTAELATAKLGTADLGTADLAAVRNGVFSLDG
jgi:hypothetical protein